MDISVLMCVYNEPLEYLESSIESILSQTYENFEFVIVGDNPDNKVNISIIEKYLTKDSRIKYIQNPNNLGLTKSLNVGLEFCKGKYIARMDADDIALPERLRLQFDYMESHPDVDVLNTYVYKFRSNGPRFLYKSPLRHKAIVEGLMTENNIVHPVVFLRQSALDIACYNESFLRSQDYCLWLDMVFKGCRFATIPKPLLNYRMSDNQISSNHHSEQRHDYLLIRSQFLNKLFQKYNINLESHITIDWLKSVYGSFQKQGFDMVQHFVFFQLSYTYIRHNRDAKKNFGKILRGFRYTSKQSAILLALIITSTSRWDAYDLTNLIDIILNKKQ